MSKYTKLEIIELNDITTNQIEENKKREAINIQKYINERDYIITLEIEGHQLSSEELAQKIDSIYQTNSTITFIIGGSYGLDDSIKKQSNYSLSFSKLTFPHQLFRIILLEQIYRSYKILHHESYHK